MGEEYQINAFDDEWDENDEESQPGAGVPLLEVRSTGSFRSLPSFPPDDESFLQYKPDKKWVFEFPLRLENWLRPFDDRVTGWVQFSYFKWLDILTNLITFAVAVEILFALPFVLFSLGIDGLATEMTWLGLLTAFFSQIPKRFVWRYRPWMVQRANKLRATTTSSFPSRAVCCSAVYAFAIAYTYFYFYGLSAPWWWIPELFVVMVFAASFSRIFLGVHYASDCVFGALQGLAICLLGTGLWNANLLGCVSCHDDACYASKDSGEQLTFSNLSEMSLLPFCIVVVLSIIVSLIMVIRPIRFWRKCDRSLGLMLPCVAFQTGFLCPNGSPTGASLAAPLSPAPIWAYPFALVVPVAILLVGTKLKSRYPLMTLSAFYVITFMCLFVWRLAIFPFAPAPEA